MSIADDIRDRRNPFSSRSVTSKAEKARCTHVAKIRRIVEARADERGVILLEALANGPVTVEDAERMTGSTTGAIPVDSPLPWDFIDYAYPKETLLRAHAATMRRLNA